MIRRVPRIRTKGWVVVGLFAVLGLAGCMRGANEMEFPHRVTFIGWSDRYEIASWSRDPINPLPCPISIHLPDADVDEKKLSDREALGWSQEDHGGGQVQMRYQRDNIVASADYEHGVLVRVGVNVLTARDIPEGILSVNGRKVSLPASEEELVGALGNPLAVARRR
jgi:hypothetical protein